MLLVAGTVVLWACAEGAVFQEGQGLTSDSGVDDAHPIVLDSAGCAMGYSTCNGQCVNTLEDMNNCGGCNLPCATPCIDGQCGSRITTSPPDAGGSGVDSGGTGIDSSTGIDTGAGGFDSSTGFDSGGFGTDSGGFGTDSGGFGTDSGGGGCAHSPCVAGVALMDGCDDSTDGVVTHLCDDQGWFNCCSTDWSQSCADKAHNDCLNSLFGCTDPACQ